MASDIVYYTHTEYHTFSVYGPVYGLTYSDNTAGFPGKTSSPLNTEFLRKIKPRANIVHDFCFAMYHECGFTVC